MKFYDSIHNCPIGVFNAVRDGGKYELLCLDSSLSVEECEQLWINIFDEFIEHFGVSANYREYWALMAQAASYKAEAYLTGNKINLTYSDLAKLKAEALAAMNEDANSTDFMTICAKVSKNMGFRVDPSVVSVVEFYSYLKAQKMAKKITSDQVVEKDLFAGLQQEVDDLTKKLVGMTTAMIDFKSSSGGAKSVFSKEDLSNAKAIDDALKSITETLDFKT